MNRKPTENMLKQNMSMSCIYIPVIKLLYSW